MSQHGICIASRIAMPLAPGWHVHGPGSLQATKPPCWPPLRAAIAWQSHPGRTDRPWEICMTVDFGAEHTLAMPLSGREPATSAGTSGEAALLYASVWPDYMIDAFQRGVLFLELPRQRGNEEIAITARPMATVLRFDHDLVMSGRALPRPMNYSLLRITPPPGVITDPRKRPVVVVEPRAGQGPGIGGFKAESQIGDALNAGHPVYFISFAAMPEHGQQFLDVVEGEVAFFERVVALHPGAPRPFAIGNCQAGYQTLMVAMLRRTCSGRASSRARRCHTGKACTASTRSAIPAVCSAAAG